MNDVDSRIKLLKGEIADAIDAVLMGHDLEFNGTISGKFQLTGRPETAKGCQFAIGSDPNPGVIREIQLVAREGVLRDMMQLAKTEGHLKTLKLLLDETHAEMKHIGMTEVQGDVQGMSVR